MTLYHLQNLDNKLKIIGYVKILSVVHIYFFTITNLNIAYTAVKLLVYHRI